MKNKHNQEIPLLYLLVMTLTLTMAGNVCADDTVQDSTFIVRPSALKEKPSTGWSLFAPSMSGVVSTRSDEIRHCFGVNATVFYDGFLPLAPTAAADFALSSVDEDFLSDGTLHMFSFSFGMTVRASGGPVRPFIGGGVTIYGSDVVFDESADFFLSGYTYPQAAKSFDMGWGVGPQVLLGLIIPIGKREGLLIQSRFLWESHRTDVTYVDRVTGEEWPGSFKYDLPTVWFSIGVIGGGHAGKKN